MEINNNIFVKTADFKRIREIVTKNQLLEVNKHKLISSKNVPIFPEF